MPHNLYLHSGLVLSRKINRNSPKVVNDASWYNFLDSAFALFVSFVINLAVLATNANSFYSPICAVADGGPYACLYKEGKQGIRQMQINCNMPTGDVGLCSPLDLHNEGGALSDEISKVSLYMWAFGLLAAGQVSTVSCTYAGQIIMRGCLGVRWTPWKRIALARTIVLALMGSAIVGNFSSYKSINEYLNVLQSVQLPFAMLPLLNFVSKYEIMGLFRSKLFVRWVTYCLAAAAIAVNGLLVAQLSASWPVQGIIVACCYAVLYLFLCTRMLFS